MMSPKGFSIVCGIQAIALGALISMNAEAAKPKKAVVNNKNKAKAAKLSAKPAKAQATTAVQTVPATAVDAKAPKPQAKLVSATSQASGTAAALDASADAQVQNSSATVSAIAPEAKSKASFLFAGLYHGPSVTRFDRYTPDEYGIADDKTGKGKVQFLEGSAIPGYNLTDTTMAAISVNFEWRPLPAEPTLGGMNNQDLKLTDPSLKIQNSKFVNSGKFNMWADGRVYLPASQASQASHQMTGIRSTQISTYELGRTTVGLVTYIRYNAFSGRADRSAANKNQDVYTYAGPNVAYQITPSLSATMLYELGAFHRLGEGFFDMNNDGTDLEPGVSWDVTKQINLSPFLNINTGGKIAADSTTLGLLFTAKML